MVIPDKFDYANSFENGLASAKSGNKWGFINKNGTFIIPAIFDKVFDFSDGVACVEIKEADQYFNAQLIPDPNGRIVFTPINQGLIDRTGKYLIPLTKNTLTSSSPIMMKDFSEGFAPIVVGKIREMKCGFVDKTGKTVIPTQFDLGQPFSDGLAAVKIGDKWGYINNKGKLVIQPIFDRVLNFP